MTEYDDGDNSPPGEDSRRQNARKNKQKKENRHKHVLSHEAAVAVGSLKFETRTSGDASERRLSRKSARRTKAVDSFEL